MPETTDQVLAQFFNLQGSDLTTIAAFVQRGQTLADLLSKLSTLSVTAIPQVPATPTVQDVVDALITLGLVTQAGA